MVDSSCNLSNDAGTALKLKRKDNEKSNEYSSAVENIECDKMKYYETFLRTYLQEAADCFCDQEVPLTLAMLLEKLVKELPVLGTWSTLHKLLTEDLLINEYELNDLAEPLIKKIISADFITLQNWDSCPVDSALLALNNASSALASCIKLWPTKMQFLIVLIEVIRSLETALNEVFLTLNSLLPLNSETMTRCEFEITSAEFLLLRQILRSRAFKADSGELRLANMKNALDHLLTFQRDHSSDLANEQPTPNATTVSSIFEEPDISFADNIESNSLHAQQLDAKTIPSILNIIQSDNKSLESLLASSFVTEILGTAHQSAENKQAQRYAPSSIITKFLGNCGITTESRRTKREAYCYDQKAPSGGADEAELLNVNDFVVTASTDCGLSGEFNAECRYDSDCEGNTKGNCEKKHLQTAFHFSRRSRKEENRIEALNCQRKGCCFQNLKVSPKHGLPRSDENKDENKPEELQHVETAPLSVWQYKNTPVCMHPMVNYPHTSHKLILPSFAAYALQSSTSEFSTKYLTTRVPKNRFCPVSFPNASLGQLTLPIATPLVQMAKATQQLDDAIAHVIYNHSERKKTSSITLPFSNLNQTNRAWSRLNA